MRRVILDGSAPIAADHAATRRVAASRRVRRPRRQLATAVATILGIVTGLTAATPVAAERLRSPAWPTLPAKTTSTERGQIRLRAPVQGMARIPAGTFVMGSSPLQVLEAVLACTREAFGAMCTQELFADEAPAHSVTLSSYFIDRTEVSVAAYMRCVAVGKCSAPPYAEGASRFAHEELPVSLVTHSDAQAYCRFRGARLPTEAEWERAARGVQSRVYPWGNLFNSRVVNHGRLGWDRSSAQDGHSELAPVWAYPSGKTESGILQLSGNVAEWVSDNYGPYSQRPQVNPKGAKSGPKIVRGGHYLSGVAWQRGAARTAADASVRRPFIGFRCAKSASTRKHLPGPR